jgi:sarcosine oxidase, subunit gamma
MADTSSFLRFLPSASRWILQGGADALAAASRSWPGGLPEQACRARSQGEHHVLWLGPDEFLLLGPQEDDAAALRLGLADVAHSLVDVGHRQVGLEISGPRCEALLAGGCALDLDVTQFPVGMCTRTAFAKADVVLWRRSESAFHLEVWRSFADYTAQLLQEIARG